jgi:predicted short-subunit dehydrogenase-like oxidoreductase (DUF2520 family)
MPERDSAHIQRPRSIATVGKGRLGGALSLRLRLAGHGVVGPLGRGETADADVALLCVPDREIAAAAAAARARFVGHTSGATGLEALGDVQAFSLHPLQTVTGEGADFTGCGCAIDGSTPEALHVARDLAVSLRMRPFVVGGSERAAYHAAASIASNFLVTLMDCAERAAESASIPRDEARAMLAPLVETTVRNWAALGPERALTGPIARGDDATVAAQRAAIPAELVPLFDAFAERTRALAQAVPA